MLASTARVFKARAERSTSRLSCVRRRSQDAEICARKACGFTFALGGHFGNIELKRLHVLWARADMGGIGIMELLIIVFKIGMIEMLSIPHQFFLLHYLFDF